MLRGELPARRMGFPMGASGRPARGSWALVVSEDAVLCARASQGLEQAGLSCEVVASGAEALSRVEGMHRDYELIVIDLDLADLPAAEVEILAALMFPGAAFVRCGTGDAASPARLAKPALASEFARTVAELRGRP